MAGKSQQTACHRRSHPVSCIVSCSPQRALLAHIYYRSQLSCAGGMPTRDKPQLWLVTSRNLVNMSTSCQLCCWLCSSMTPFVLLRWQVLSRSCMQVALLTAGHCHQPARSEQAHSKGVAPVLAACCLAWEALGARSDCCIGWEELDLRSAGWKASLLSACTPCTAQALQSRAPAAGCFSRDALGTRSDCCIG